MCFVPTAKGTAFRAATIRRNVDSALTTWTTPPSPKGADTPIHVVVESERHPRFVALTGRGLYCTTEETDEDLF